jgi:hypothetical protein
MTDKELEHVKAFFTDGFPNEPRVINRIAPDRTRKFQGKIIDTLVVGDRVFIKIHTNKVSKRLQSGEKKWVDGECVTILPMDYVEHIFASKISHENLKEGEKLEEPDDEEEEVKGSKEKGT